MTPAASPVPIVVIGTGGNAIEIVETIRDINDASATGDVYDLRGFLDDDPARRGTMLHGLPILGPLKAAGEFPDCRFVNGIGSPANFWRRGEIVARTGLTTDRFETIVHPTATVARSAHLGRGVVLLPHVTIGANARLGDHVVVLPNSVISHDSTVGAHTCVAASVAVSGATTVGASCYLGSRCALIGSIRIGDGSLVGLGAVVLADVPPDTVVAGVPARTLRRVRPANAA